MLLELPLHKGSTCRLINPLLICYYKYKPPLCLKPPNTFWASLKKVVKKHVLNTFAPYSQRVKRILATGIHNRSRCAVPGFGSTGIPSFLQLPWIRTENLIWSNDGWSCRCFLRDGRLWNHRLLVGAKVLVSPRPKGMRWNLNPAIMCSTAARLKVINNAVPSTEYSVQEIEGGYLPLITWLRLCLCLCLCQE